MKRPQRRKRKGGGKQQPCGLANMLVYPEGVHDPLYPKLPNISEEVADQIRDFDLLQCIDWMHKLEGWARELRGHITGIESMN